MRNEIKPAQGANGPATTEGFANNIQVNWDGLTKEQAAGLPRILRKVLDKKESGAVYGVLRPGERAITLGDYTYADKFQTKTRMEIMVTKHPSLPQQAKIISINDLNVVFGTHASKSDFNEILGTAFNREELRNLQAILTRKLKEEVFAKIPPLE